MKRLLKWLALALAALIAVALVLGVSMMLATDARMAKTYAVEPRPLDVSAGLDAVAAGRHLAAVHCAACHGDDMAGAPFLELDNLGYVDASNLTPGPGGVGATFSDVDWVRAIRHGVRPDGKPLLIMPSADFQHLSDADLSALIAYLKSLPAVDNQTRRHYLTPLARVLYAAGAFGNIIAAEQIDHVAASAPAAAEPDHAAASGEYLVTLGGCRSCHGQDLSGGQSAKPGTPAAPDLTRSGAIGSWSEADFVETLRQGTRPDGRRLSDYMPWRTLGRMSDEELHALWLYLQSLPPQTAQSS